MPCRGRFEPTTTAIYDRRSRSEDAARCKLNPVLRCSPARRCEPRRNQGFALARIDYAGPTWVPHAQPEQGARQLETRVLDPRCTELRMRHFDEMLPMLELLILIQINGGLDHVGGHAASL